MTDTGSVLTYAGLLEEIMGQGQSSRFPATRHASARRWLAAAYQDVWAAADWTFKTVLNQAWRTVTGGNDPTATPVMPADFLGILDVYNDEGDRLPKYERGELQTYYRPLADSATTGPPEAYTVVNRQIILGPAPDQAYTFTLDYRRRLAHKDADGIVMAGFFQDTDTDHVPLWDDHHYILVPRAQVIGLKSLNDPTWPPLLDDYQAMLASMVSDYVDWSPIQYPGDPDH